MMIKAVTHINWKYPGDGIPAFLTIVVMPFTYSIAYGLIAGICSYAVINSAVKIVEVVSCGKIETPGKEDKEPWTWRIPVVPAWMGRIARGKWRFWRENESGGVGEDPDAEKQAGAGARAGNGEEARPSPRRDS